MAAIARHGNDSLVDALVRNRVLKNEESHRCHEKGRSRELLRAVFRPERVRGSSIADWIERDDFSAAHARGVFGIGTRPRDGERESIGRGKR